MTPPSIRRGPVSSAAVEVDEHSFEPGAIIRAVGPGNVLRKGRVILRRVSGGRLEATRPWSRGIWAIAEGDLLIEEEP